MNMKDKARELMLSLIYDYGMKLALESMIEILGNPSEPYLVTLKADLTTALNNYESRHFEE